LGSKTPLQAMKDWHKLKPELFKKQPYHLPRCDSGISPADAGAGWVGSVSPRNYATFKFPPTSRHDPVRHRTTKTKGCLSRQTALAMTHQLMLSAQKKRRKLDGQNRLPEIIEGIEFRDRIKHEIKAA